MTISDYENTLLTTKAFKYLNLNELDVIKGYCKIVKFNRNELLFEQGKMNVGMYIILKGNAAVVAKTLGKNILNLATLDVGDFFGEVSLIQKTSCTATVIANEEVHCLSLTTDYFDMLILFYPEIRYKITKAIMEEVCGRLINLYNNINQIIDKMNISKELISKSDVIEPILELTTLQDSRIHEHDLLRSDFFKIYTHDEISLLINHSELTKVSKNFNIIKAKGTHSEYYFIIRGAVQLSISHKNKKAKLAVLSPISVFSSMSNVTNTTAMINHIACERALLLKISIEKLNEINMSHKSLWYKLYNAICKSFIASERAANKLIIRLNSEEYNR